MHTNQSSFWRALVGAMLALVAAAPAVAQEIGIALTSADAFYLDLGPDAILVFTGADSYAEIAFADGECGTPGWFPLQQVVVIRPGQAARVIDVIVFTQPEPVAPGTRAYYSGDCGQMLYAPCCDPRGDGWWYPKFANVR